MERTTRRRLMLSPSRAGPCSVAAHNVRAACAKHGAAQQLDRGPPRRCQRHARSNTWSRPDTPRQQPAPKWGVGLRKVARGTAAHRRSRSELSLDTRGWSTQSPANDHPKACQDVTAEYAHYAVCWTRRAVWRNDFRKGPEMTAVDWTRSHAGARRPGGTAAPVGGAGDNCRRGGPGVVLTNRTHAWIRWGGRAQVVGHASSSAGKSSSCASNCSAAATGIATSAPTIPSSAAPIRTATTVTPPGTFTARPMTLGTNR